MRIGCGILFDGSDRRSSDEPEIELTATALNRLVRDAGTAAQAGLYSKRLHFAAAFHLCSVFSISFSVHTVNHLHQLSCNIG